MKDIKVPLTTLVRVKKIVTCFKRRVPSDFFASMEAHDFWELVYVESGRMIAMAGGCDVEMKAGDVIFHAPDAPHGLRGNGKDPFSFFIVTFDTSSVAMQPLAYRKCRVSPAGAALLSGIYEERVLSFSKKPGTILLSVREDAPLGGPQMIQLYLEQFLIGVLRDAKANNAANLFTSRTELKSHIAGEVRTYLEEHLYDNVTMDDLCRTLHYGKSRLSHIFREAYGDSIIHYYITRKLEKAGEALRDGEGDVADIAARFGFESPQYFSRIFRRYMGVSPRDYRKNDENGG